MNATVRFGDDPKERPITAEMALEMLFVGIVPSDNGPDTEPVGYAARLGPFDVEVVGYATREEFLDRIAEIGFDRSEFDACPQGMFFQKISSRGRQ